MSFRPDIVVTGGEPPRFRLVVEVKRAGDRFDAAARGLREYLFKMSCPVGMLVGPENVHIFNNRYSTTGLDAVEQVGTFAWSGPWDDGEPRGRRRTVNEYEFEREVQAWLESLPQTIDTQTMPEALRKSLKLYVLPMLEGGTIGAAGPRSFANR